MISNLSILFMAVSAVVSIGLPIAIYIIWRKKYELKIIPCLFGAAFFILFALILEPLLHRAVLNPTADGYIALKENNPILYVLYAILAAGVFEETARFISFGLLKKKYSGIRTGLSYGIGHGGIESIILAGIPMITSIVIALMVNGGNTVALGISPDMKTQVIDPIVNTDSIRFLVSGIERILAVAIQISLSVIVWKSVNIRGKFWLYPAAIAIHAIIDLPAVLYQIGVIENIALVEIIIGACAVILSNRAYLMAKRLRMENL